MFSLNITQNGVFWGKGQYFTIEICLCCNLTICSSNCNNPSNVSVLLYHLLGVTTIIILFHLHSVFIHLRERPKGGCCLEFQVLLTVSVQGEQTVELSKQADSGQPTVVQTGQQEWKTKPTSAGPLSSGSWHSLVGAAPPPTSNSSPSWWLTPLSPVL